MAAKSSITVPVYEPMVIFRYVSHAKGAGLRAGFSMGGSISPGQDCLPFPCFVGPTTAYAPNRRRGARFNVLFPSMGEGFRVRPPGRTTLGFIPMDGL